MSDGESGRGNETLGDSIRVLITLPIVLCWIFFLMVAMGQIGLQTFSPTLLDDIYGFDLETGGAIVTVMLFAVTIGVLAGGYLADNFQKPDHVVLFGYTAAAIVIIAVWRLELDVVEHYIAFAAIGFMYGVVFPSRELLVRAATPKGASGRVFGFVYSGMDFGSTMTPILFGWFVDTGIPALGLPLRRPIVGDIDRPHRADQHGNPAPRRPWRRSRGGGTWRRFTHRTRHGPGSPARRVSPCPDSTPRPTASMPRKGINTTTAMTTRPTATTPIRPHATSSQSRPRMDSPRRPTAMAAITSPRATVIR